MDRPAAELRVGYNPALGTVFMALAIVQVVLGAISGAGMSIGLGLLFVVIATLYLTMPYFVLVEGAVQLRNLLGMTMRQYTFAARSQLEVEGRVVTLVHDDGRRERVKLARWLARRSDWDRFIAALSARAFD